MRISSPQGVPRFDGLQCETLYGRENIVFGWSVRTTEPGMREEPAILVVEKFQPVPIGRRQDVLDESMLVPCESEQAASGHK